MGTLNGVARHHEPKGPIETVEAVPVTAAEGVQGDFRGGLVSTKPGCKRQVSLIERESWDAAAAETRCPLEWWNSRCNLLAEVLRLPRKVGAKLRIGGTLVVQIAGECNPCARMEALHAGLRAAPISDWRGGFLARVIADGEIAVGDEIRIV